MNNDISNIANSLELEKEKLIAQMEENIKMALTCLVKLEELSEIKEDEN